MLQRFAISCPSAGPFSPAVPRRWERNDRGETSLEILEKFNLGKLLVERRQECRAD